MPSSSMEAIQGREFHSQDVSKVLQKWLAASSQQSEWCYGAFRIEELAQDQVIFRIDRGAGCETYRGIRSADKDAQSEATGLAHTMNLVDKSWILQAVNTQFNKAWTSFEGNAQNVFCPSINMDLDESLEESEEESIVHSSDYLVDAILTLDSKADWCKLRELILYAEDTSFTSDQSRELAPRLLQLATLHRDSSDSQDEQVVWSAIRRGAAMLSPLEANLLLPLLEPGHAIETTLVTLKMVGRLFEVQPPLDVDQFDNLASEAKKIADSLLNRYAISSSQSATLALLAIYALAAMGSKELWRLVEIVRGINVTWFERRMYRKLGELREYWTRSPNPMANTLRDLLEHVLENSLVDTRLDHRNI